MLVVIARFDVRGNSVLSTFYQEADYGHRDLSAVGTEDQL